MEKMNDINKKIYIVTLVYNRNSEQILKTYISEKANSAKEALGEAVLEYLNDKELVNFGLNNVSVAKKEIIVENNIINVY